MKDESFPRCPLNTIRGDLITLAHGGGGQATAELIENLFLPHLASPFLDQRHDGALLDELEGRPVITTDSFVVKPLFFPGGDIGKLSVWGTANDLAMCGARPRFLSVSFIIEEGLPLADLARVVDSMAEAARSAGMAVTAGDTKVIEGGRGDGLYISASGLGELVSPEPVLPRRVRRGDALVVSGDVGRHGVAVMAAREELAFEETVASDCRCLFPHVEALLDAGVEIHCLRDLTRGGLTAALTEVAEAAGVSIDIEEAAVPVDDRVRGACELLGLDPFHVACEGRFLAIVPGGQGRSACEILAAVDPDQEPALIGTVSSEEGNRVISVSPLGVRRVVQRPSGTLLPRIC